MQDLAQDFVHDLRSALEVAGSSSGATLLVGGDTAVGIDFADVLSSKLPVFIAIVVFKLFGISPASAVCLDALVIGTLLPPAVLELLRRITWTLPRWLDRRLPRVSIEPEPAPCRRPPDPALEARS